MIYYNKRLVFIYNWYIRLFYCSRVRRSVQISKLFVLYNDNKVYYCIYICISKAKYFDSFFTRSTVGKNTIVPQLSKNNFNKQAKFRFLKFAKLNSNLLYSYLLIFLIIFLIVYFMNFELNPEKSFFK